jgi:hypothetical protein
VFEAIYASSWHHPYSFWAAGGPVLALLVVRARAAAAASVERARLAALCVAFQLGILADAWLNAKALSPLTGAAATAAGVTFVILGDFRYFLLLARYGRGLGWAAALPAALAVSLVVPVGSFLTKREGRALFLIYELALATVAVAVRVLVVPRVAEARRRWMAWLTEFEIAQYAAWATADVIILSGHDAGYLLRLVPNAMYYIGFVPFAWLTAPKDLDA